MARTAPPSRTGQLFAALGALAVVGLTGALPFLLIWAAGNPLDGLSGWFSTLSSDPGAALTTLWQALVSRDDGDLFLHTLAIVGWIAAALAAWAWASFLVAFVVELVAQARARRQGRIAHNAKPIKGMRLQQRAAAVLAAAVIGAVATPTLASASVTMPPTFGQPAAAATQHVAAPTATADTQHADAVKPAATGGYLEHEVQRGEGLLDVADQYGVSLQRLAEANHGVTQPDGRSLQPSSTRIYAGWTLRVPITAVATTTATTQAAPNAEPDGPLVYKVTRGDNLSGIADRFLGDPDRYPEITRQNPQLEQRDPRFPNHIEATWQITLPDDADDRGVDDHARGTVVQAAATGHTPPPQDQPQTEAPPTEHTAPQPTTSATPSTSAAPSTPSPTATNAPTTAAPAAPNATTSTAPAAAPSTAAAPMAQPGSPPPGSASPSASASPEVSAAPSVENSPAIEPSSDMSDTTAEVIVASLAGAGLLSALLLGAVRRQRRRQQQHRAPGRRLPHPRAGATERTLRIVEQPADVDRLDLALRHLAAALAERGHDRLPNIGAAWIIERSITLVLTDPHDEPPAPWQANDREWTLAGDVELAAIAEQLAPLPTLVAVGSQPGRHLLLDLEYLGSLSITGEPDRALALLRYLASELACNSWSDDVEVIAAGFPADEAEHLVALNPDRVRIVTSVRDAVARLQRRTGSVTAAITAADATDTFGGRITDIGEAWTPQVLVVANPAPADAAALAELARTLSGTGRCAVAVATTVSATGQDNPSRYTAAVTANGELQLDLPFLHTTAQAAGLPAGELQPLAEIMTLARAQADEPVPPAPEPEPWADGTDAAGALLRLVDQGPALTSAEPVTDEQWAESLTAVAAVPDPILATPLITALPTSTPPKVVTAAIRQRRRQSDPTLDADLRAWREQDSTPPRIGILGPVTVEAPGPAPDQRRKFHAEIIVYLAQRGTRGATGDQLSEALWPDQGVKDSSRRVAITRVRRWLGDTPDAAPWLPEMGADRLYRLRDGYLLDWHLFRRLRSRGESHGAAGVKDLRAALELVRGAPLDGADRAYAATARNPFAWLPESDIYPGHIASAVVDTAHQLAQLYLDAGDTIGARWAVHCAWQADPTRGDDHPWQDLMRAVHADGRTAELRNLLDELVRTRDAEYPEDLPPDTYALLQDLLPDVLGAH